MHTVCVVYSLQKERGDLATEKMHLDATIRVLAIQQIFDNLIFAFSCPSDQTTITYPEQCLLQSGFLAFQVWPLIYQSLKIARTLNCNIPLMLLLLLRGLGYKNVDTKTNAKNICMYFHFKALPKLLDCVSKNLKMSFFKI